MQAPEREQELPPERLQLRVLEPVQELRPAPNPKLTWACSSATEPEQEAPQRCFAPTLKQPESWNQAYQWCWQPES